MGYILNKRSQVHPSPFLGLAQHKWKCKTLTSSTPTIMHTDCGMRSFPACFISDSQFPLGASGRGAGPPAGWKLRLREVNSFVAGRKLPSEPSAHSMDPLPALHQLGFHVENRLCPGGKQMRFRLLTIKIIAVQTGQRPAGSQTLPSFTAGESGVTPRTPTTSCGAGLQCPGLAQPAHACEHAHPRCMSPCTSQVSQPPRSPPIAQQLPAGRARTLRLATSGTSQASAEAQRVMSSIADPSQPREGVTSQDVRPRAPTQAPPQSQHMHQGGA